MIQVGVYIATLRQGSPERLSQGALAERIGVSEKIIRDWEKGKHEPKVSLMNALLRVLHGAWEDITQLMHDEVDDEVARTLARRRLNYQGLTEEQLAYLEALNPEQRQAVIEVARQMLRR